MMFQSQNLRLLSIKFLMGDILLAAFNDIFSFVLKYLSPRLNFSEIFSHNCSGKIRATKGLSSKFISNKIN